MTPYRSDSARNVPSQAANMSLTSQTMAPKPSETESPTLIPATPRKASAAKNGTTPATPHRRTPVQAGATPKSAPAATGNGPKKKPEPNLLADFLLGRPSPARLANQKSTSKQRRKSVALDAAGVREELRQEMRAVAVRRLQQPGGVRDRVKAWQKASQVAMKAEGGGAPDSEDVASEPTEFAAHIDAQSVTEEDRVRIKLRQKKKRKPQTPKLESADMPRGGKSDGEISKSGNEGRDVITVEPAEETQPRERPKKRIVSDDNWMKRNRGKGPTKGATPKPKVEGSPTPIPKDFLLRTAQNPSVQNKIKDWAKRVEIPDPAEPPREAQRRPPRETTRVKQYHTKAEETVTVEEDASSVAALKPDTKAKPTVPFDDGIRVRPMKQNKPKADMDDGIRVTPIRKKKEPPDDGTRALPSEEPDGIRVRPVESTRSDDDGIRVRPVVVGAGYPDDGIRIYPGRKVSSSRNSDITVRSASSRETSVERSTRVPSTRRERSLSPSRTDVIEVIEAPESDVATPTRRRRVSSRPRARQSRSPMVEQPKQVLTDECSDSGMVESIPHFAADADNISERVPPSVAGNKSLADIPFGYSAFSVLELPLKNGPKKSKVQKTPSFKAMPNVFKKVMSGAKEIIHEKVDPPKPVANQPPSIERWLNNTVDPFVDTPKEAQSTKAEQREGPPKRSVSQSRQREAIAEPQRRSSSQGRPQDVTTNTPKRSTSRARHTEPAILANQTAVENEENHAPVLDDSDATPRKAKAPTTSSTALKRRRATRSASSPIKSSGKKPFREALKEAFRGESGGHKLPPVVYPSYQAESEPVSDPDEGEWSRGDRRRRSTGSTRRSPSPDPSSPLDSSQSSSVLTDPYPSRRRPPTNGKHELSTIVSGGFSSVVSDTISDVSQTTITQTTAFTKSTGLSRQKSQKSSLRRRLTKHSDLVSVLSLPDDGQLVPVSRSKSIKSTRSLHRKPSKLHRGRIDELLDEFADDESFYGRELKTLVDGVVPVLLKEVIQDNKQRGGLSCATGSPKTEDAMAKAVVSMGVVLERLRNLHRSVPLSDIRHLLTWLETIAEVYDEYFDVWCLGFQDLIVNLAPAYDRFAEEDSLVDALPRNEDGDILGEHGERVDVAYLLKRPLIRVKWMTKFLKVCVQLSPAARVNLARVLTPELSRLLF